MLGIAFVFFEFNLKKKKKRNSSKDLKCLINFLVPQILESRRDWVAIIPLLQKKDDDMRLPSWV